MAAPPQKAPASGTRLRRAAALASRAAAHAAHAALDHPGAVARLRLRSFSRHERRILLAALDAVVAGNRARLGDVAQYAERWKRLGERLHPHEYPQWPGALEVFAVARGQIRVPSAGSRSRRRCVRATLRAPRCC
jgi:hypothetical protein